MRKVSLPGREVPPKPLDSSDALLEREFGIAIVRHQEVDGVVRGEPLTRELFEVDEDNDVVELQFDGGVVQYLRAADLIAESGVRRGDDGVVEVPVLYRRGRGTERGLVEWVSQRLRIFRPTRPLSAIAADALTGGAADRVLSFAEEQTARLAARRIVAKFDERQTPPAGLYRITAEGEMVVVPPSESLDDISRPWLVFIHGTASSTEGSFGGLFGERDAVSTTSLFPKRALTRDWQQLAQAYGDRIVALQHPTLSVSPVDNAFELATRLPAGARLHLVTHSRGGLVGELLALGDISGARFEPYEASYGTERADRLRAFGALLQRKKFTIEKFVRVACPARGTILASERLDIYLSMLLNLFGAIPLLRENPLYDFLKGTAIELIRLRAKPEFLPGLQVQMPGSAFINFLAQGHSTSDLAVIAGDAEGDTFWQRLKLLGTDAFYRKEHDLVVNTDAMFGGLGRDSAYGFYHRGGVVNHFSYFRNERTRARLRTWLLSKERDREFQEFKPSQSGIPVRESRAAAANDLRPVLIVVPDVLGSVLALPEKEPYWPDAAAIARRGFALHSRDLQPIGLVNAYAPLVTRWGGTHQVIGFPWDWRGSVAAAADRLADTIASHAGKGAVSVIAHGSGGLVVQQLQLRQDRAAWDALGRVLFLGTPYYGTFAAVDWCTPASRLVSLLALADGREDAAARIAAELANCDAVLESAPRDFLSDPARWGAVGAVTPPAEKLARALGFRTALEAAPRDGKLIAVAGRANETLVSADPAGNVTYSPDGDGRVVSSNLHRDVPRWQVEARHGDLVSFEGAFAAYLDLLKGGKTEALAPAQNIVGSPTTRPRLPSFAMLFPQTDDLVREAVDASRSEDARGEVFPIAVSVTHGNLANARFPVAVGHYLGDMIVSAEATLDCQLGRRLSRRFQLGLYPGAAGTVEVIRMADAKPPGALIVGLGIVGRVAPDTVRRGITAVAVRHALLLAEERGQKKAPGPWRSAAFSAVAIGTKGGSAMTLEASIAAIIRGALDANRMLRAQGVWDEARIDAIELVELYEERAIATSYALRRAVDRLRNELERDERLDLEPRLRVTPSGRFRVPLEEEHSDWWQRLFITVDEQDRNKRPNAPMRYVVLSERARAEAELQCRERRATDALIDSAIASRSFDAGTSGALFELLIPNDIKAASDSAPSVVLILDEETARYPWELLADPFTRERKPYSVRTGMLRQFISIDPRSAPRYALEKRAFIVGDTNIGADETGKEPFPPLRGAQSEARAVSTVLASANFETRLLLRPAGQDVRKQLFTESFRILHLAGHGTYDPDRPEESGMVLGLGDFLTACQLRQLRTVPDFVFLNCCFLGVFDGGKQPASSVPVDGKPHFLAANIAQELISMGVKAIVAAGWAVDDAAAVTFASTLYDEMLTKKRTFGDAVRTARAAVFGSHSGTNTWGAYQCYGNPGFMLADEDGGDGREAEFLPCARREYIDVLRSMDAEATELGNAPDGDKLKELQKRLTDLTTSNSIPREWSDGEVLALVGRIWRNVGDYAHAIEVLEQAIAAEKAAMPIEGVELLANMLVRRARQVPATEAEKLLDRAKKLLDALLELGVTSERYSLLGSLHKRQAIVRADAARLEALKRAADAYEAAAKVREGKGVIDPYPILNAVALRWLADPSATILQKELTRAAAVVQANATSDDYYKRAGLADHLLASALVSETVDVDAIVHAYRVAAMTAKPGEILSAVEHVEFLIDMLEEGPRTPLKTALREISRKLRGGEPGTAAGGGA